MSIVISILNSNIITKIILIMNNEQMENTRSSATEGNYLFEQFRLLVHLLVEKDISESYDFDSIYKILKLNNLEDQFNNPTLIKSIKKSFGKLQKVTAEEMQFQFNSFLEKYKVEDKLLELCKLQLALDCKESSQINDTLSEAIEVNESSNIDDYLSFSEVYIKMFLKQKINELNMDIEASEKELAHLKDENKLKFN